MQRIFDFTLALIGLIIFFPVMIIVSIGIKITSSGPIFYKQYRVGFKEKLFYIYKFRTMFKNADTMGSVTTEKDTRITSFGRFLRFTKLDELPQLINIVKGDMSFIGPRPDVPEIVANYTPEMKKIFSIKPGLTGLATLHFKDEERILSQVCDPEKFYIDFIVPLKVKIGLEQLGNNSFIFNLKILLQTIWILLPFSKLVPIREHHLVIDLKKQLRILNKNEI